LPPSKFYDFKPQRAQISGFLWGRQMFGIAKEEIKDKKK
jgi:hypothetical protein